MTLAITRIDGWSVATDGNGDEPRILDLELGERLGFARPRDIRKLIERLLKDEKLKDIRISATVARIELRPGIYREQAVNEYWLTRPQALLVIAKSETEIALRILNEVIDVFEAFLRGQLVAPQERSVAVLPNSPTIGDAHRADIKTRCARTARCIRASVQRVQGCLRKPYKVSSVYQIDDVFYDRVCHQLERLERGDEQLPSRGPRLLKAAADSTQCELPFPKTKRGAS